MTRRTVAVLGMVALTLGAVAPACADERADWGLAVVVGAEAGEYQLLLRNDAGFHLLAVAPTAPVAGAGLDPMTFTDVRPGDRLDFAVATWAGMDVVEMIQVTSIRHAEARR